jgi:hypothetical protein
MLLEPANSNHPIDDIAPEPVQQQFEESVTDPEIDVLFSDSDDDGLADEYRLLSATTSRLASGVEAKKRQVINLDDEVQAAEATYKKAKQESKSERRALLEAKIASLRETQLELREQGQQLDRQIGQRTRERETLEGKINKLGSLKRQIEEESQAQSSPPNNAVMFADPNRRKTITRVIQNGPGAKRSASSALVPNAGAPEQSNSAVLASPSKSARIPNFVVIDHGPADKTGEPMNSRSRHNP